MNKKIYDHLKNYCNKKGFDLHDDDILEILQEEECLYNEEVDQKRHWDEYFNVVEIDGMLIGYYDAKRTGDLTAHECGWEFDKDSCCEVEEVTETKVVTLYKILK